MRPCNTQTVQECFDRCKKLPWGTCLSRTLAQVRLLRLRGIEADCIIGMEKSPEFKAHAWVDISTENDRFTADDSFPSRIKLGQNGRAK